MGSKKLKAITVRGTGGVKVANPEKLMDTCRHIEYLVPQTKPKLDVIEGKYDQKLMACQSCSTICHLGSTMVLNVPGRVHPGLLSALTTCVEERWLIKGWNIPDKDYKYQ